MLLWEARDNPSLVPVSSFAARIDEQERRLYMVTAELPNLKNESAVEAPEYTSSFGFGPAASKVYHLNKGLSIGGYGEGQFKQYVSDKGTKLIRPTCCV